MSRHRSILNNGYLVGELPGYTAQDRICIPVPFTTASGMVMGKSGATSHAPDGAGLTCNTLRAVVIDDAPVTACRRCSSPSWACRTSPTTNWGSLRTGIWPAPRAWSRWMRKVHPRAYARGLDLLWNDRNVTGFHETRADFQTRWIDGSHGRSVVHTLRSRWHPAYWRRSRARGGRQAALHEAIRHGWYWNDPQMTAEGSTPTAGCTPEIWLRWTRPGKYVRIAGLIKDLVKPGRQHHLVSGRSRTPSNTHPDIMPHHVIGCLDAKYGEELMAVVVL